MVIGIRHDFLFQNLVDFERHEQSVVITEDCVLILGHRDIFLEICHLSFFSWWKKCSQ